MTPERLIECSNISPAFIPVDTQSAANNGDYVSMKDYHRCLVVLFKAVGVAGDDPVFNLQQATNNAGAGVKDLLFDEVFTKLAVDITTLGIFTRVAQTAATSYTNATSAEMAGLICVEINSDMLDADNGFDHIRLDVADTGAAGAQLAGALYIMYDPRSAQGIPISAL